MTIFISYSHFDYDKASKLKFALESVFGNYCDIYFCSNRLIGVNFYQSINVKLNTSETLIFIATENSIHSDWCAYEIGFMNGRGKIIIPLLFGIEYQSMPAYSSLLLGVKFDEKNRIKEMLDLLFGNLMKIDDEVIIAFYRAYKYADGINRKVIRAKEILTKYLDGSFDELNELMNALNCIDDSVNDNDTYELLLQLICSDNEFVRIESFKRIKKFIVDDERLMNILAQLERSSYSNTCEMIEYLALTIKKNKNKDEVIRQVEVCLSDRGNILSELKERLNRLTGGEPDGAVVS